MERLAWLLVFLLGACDPQVDSDYAGQPVLELRGSVVAAGPVGIGRMVIAWVDDDPVGPGGVVSPLALTTSYPADFAVSLIDLPPPAARRAFHGESDFAEGYLFAIDEQGQVAGSDFGHALVWAADPLGASPTTVAYLGGEPDQGFSVATRDETAVPGPEQAVFVGRCVDRALAMGWDPARADFVCAAAHRYRLLPSTQGLATRWQVHVVAGGP